MYFSGSEVSDLGLHCQQRETLNFKIDSPFPQWLLVFKKKQQHEARYSDPVYIYIPQIGSPIINFLRNIPILVGYYGTVFYLVGYSTVQTFSHSHENASVFQTWIMFWGVRL